MIKNGYSFPLDQRTTCAFPLTVAALLPVSQFGRVQLRIFRWSAVVFAAGLAGDRSAQPHASHGKVLFWGYSDEAWLWDPATAGLAPRPRAGTTFSAQVTLFSRTGDCW